MNNSSPTEKLFFSIVIPAHNEEQYISTTLEHLAALDYPPERYEVIVVENGSADRTYETAKKFESSTIKVFSVTTKGVSLAKNFGIDRTDPKSDWLVLLDADTLLKRDFLTYLNDFFLKPAAARYAVGTTEVLPISPTATAKFWFAFYNFSHKLTATSYSLQIVRSSLARTIHFDSQLVTTEDLTFIRAARAYGKFFYFPTKDVYTSTRRFEQEGWLKVFFNWTFVALLPARFHHLFSYKVVR